MKCRLSDPARLAIVAIAVCTCASALHMLRPWQDAWCDLQFQLRDVVLSNERRTALRSADIVLVGWDEDSAREWPQRSPVPRAHLAKVIEQLHRAGARTILVDVLFDHPAPDDDKVLAAMRSAGNVVIPSHILEPTPGQRKLVLPQSAFAEAAAAVGVGSVPVEDGAFVRTVQPSIRVGGQAQPFLAAAAVAHFQGRAPLDVAREYEARWASWDRRMCGDNRILVDYSTVTDPNGQPVGWRAFPSRYAADGVLSPFFKDKLVIVGSKLDDTADRFHTPLSRHWLIPTPRPWAGIEIIAHVANMGLTGRGVRNLSWVWWIALQLLVALPVASAARERGLFSGVIFGLSAAVLWFAASAILFVLAGRALDAVAPCTALLVIVGLGVFQHRSEQESLARHEAERLERVARERKAVVGSVIHDLKQPITIIKLDARSLLRSYREHTVTPLQTEELLQTIDSQCNELIDRIEDLLSVDSPEPITVMPTPVDLTELAREVAKRYQAQSARHDVKVSTTLPHVVLADAGKVRRILANLVHNAIKYSPDGGPVRVDLTDNEKEFVLSVTDKGIGMTLEQQQRAFDLYARVADPKLGIDGTGVGLYAVKRLVEAHGWNITVQSQLGAGSVFTIRIPRPEETGAENGNGTPRSTAAAPEAQRV